MLAQGYGTLVEVHFISYLPPHLMASVVEALVCDLHGSALRIVGAHSGVHFVDWSQASRTLRCLGV